MDEFGGDWALFEELGSRAMADLYAENSKILGESVIRNRAFAAEGLKVTSFELLPGLFFGIETELEDNASDEEKKEYALECQRVYEIVEVQADGRLLSKLVWPEEKKDDPKAGTVWVVRPNAVDWIYHPNEGAPRADSSWRKEWDALQESARARWSLLDE
jgi:hypothetical protein